MEFDRDNNWNCKNCVDCKDCAGCTDCKNCNEFSRHCKGCKNCENCTLCTDCKGCTDCTNCTGLVDCKDYENNQPRVHGAVVYFLMGEGDGTAYGVFSSLEKAADCAGDTDEDRATILADFKAHGYKSGYYVVELEVDRPDIFDI